MFYLVAISDATKDFLPENKDSLNWIELNES